MKFLLLILRFCVIIYKNISNIGFKHEKIIDKPIILNEEEKEFIMAKEPSKPVENKTSNMTHSAISTAKIGDKWGVVEIRFNPETKETGDVTFTNAGFARSEAVELFKKMAVNLNLVTN